MLIWRLRGRENFAALRAHGRRGRSGPVSVTFLPAAVAAARPLAATTRVAFAVGRPVGPAVVRNRVRRRLRSIAAGADLPPGDYLVRVGPPVADMSFERLQACAADAMRSAATRPAATRPAMGAQTDGTR